MVAGDRLVWGFGYRALMWDKRGLSFWGEGGDSAILRNYRRSFNKKSTRNWGTPDAPGPTLGLEPNANVECCGTAFEFAEENGEAVKACLRKREGASFALVKLPVQLHDGREVEAITAL